MRAAIYDADGKMVMIVVATEENIQMNADAIEGVYVELPEEIVLGSFTDAIEYEWCKTPPRVWPDGRPMTEEELYASSEPQNVV